ncbi:MAG: DUF421 domain-containing protein [Coriobacteriia bacterium]
MFGDINWADVFLPSISPLEIIVRGSLIYLGTFILLRVITKRELGGVSVGDLIVIVFIADAAQNGMAGEYKSVFDGLLLVAVLIAWAFVLDRLAYRFPWFERLTKPPPLKIVSAGQIMPRNLRQEAITKDELWATLREHGVSDLSEVAAAFVEHDGTISVIKRKEAAE